MLFRSKVDDAIAEIQNDKLLQEILSPYSGKITKLFVEAGTVVEVGAPLIEFDGDGSGSAAGDAAPAPAASEPVAEAAPAVPAPIAAINEAVAQEAAAPVEGKTAPVIAGKVRAMPTVRRFARQNNIDLTTVAATGRHGNLTLDDVKNALNGTGAPVAPVEAEVAPLAEPAAVAAAPASAPAEKAGRVPMTPIRKAIARNMTSQKQNVPHVT